MRRRAPDVLLDQPGHRRLPIADDEVVDRATDITTVAGREATLVTDDVGQAYRARLAGMEMSIVVTRSTTWTCRGGSG